MQVFGLPAQIIRNGGAASRLLSAQPPHIEGERRRDAVARWLKARAAGLTAERAAGASRSTLDRWRKRAQPLSRRPRRVRGTNRPAGLAAAVERLRLDFPMWGRAKIGPLVRELGFAVSDATAGRILSDLIRRGRVPAVPAPLRKIGPRSAAKKRPYAIRKLAQCRLPKARRRRADRHPVNLDPARPGDQALHRLRSLRQVDRWPAL